VLANLANMDQALKAGELRRRLGFTLLMFIIFRLGVFIPVPGVDAAKLSVLLAQGQVSLYGLLNLFSGGAFTTFSVFAMSIIPYINASIIMQLLTEVIPTVKEWSKEGAEGQRKMVQWTRYLTIALALIQAFGITVSLSRLGAGVITTPGIGTILFITVTLAAGSMVLMWIGEMITAYGIGNGTSLIIFIGIVGQLPTGIGTLFSYLTAGTVSPTQLVLLCLVGLVVIAFVVWVVEAERRVPVQYAKRLVGRRMYSGGSTHIPIKVNAAGVIPVIFAVSILVLPTTIANFWPNASVRAISQTLLSGQWLYPSLLFVLVVAFTFFYTSFVFKPDDIADNMKKYGGFIPGIRPGRPTAQYLARISARITVLGALFLGLIAVLPTFIVSLTNIPNIYFGGTALLIVVGVALDTMKQVQAQLVMRNYQGFLR
jgi:preprotein translocase subunit SecY